MGKSVWDFIAPVLGATAGTLLLPGLGTALGASIGSGGGAAIGAGIGSGLATGAETGNPLAGLASGAASGVGSYAGGQLLGSTLGNIGSTTDPVTGGQTAGFLGQPVAKSLSDTALSGVSNAFGSTTPGDILGGAAGSGIAQGMAQSAAPGLFSTPSSVSTSTSPPSWQPSEQSPMALPGSLSAYSNLNPQQQATNIASRGVFGGGNGPSEQNYFLNLINRQLFDQGGNVASNTNGLAPVDLSYLNQLGISGSTPTDYLKGISQFGA